jgi:hypothetical protein
MSLHGSGRAAQRLSVDRCGPHSFSILIIFPPLGAHHHFFQFLWLTAASLLNRTEDYFWIDAPHIVFDSFLAVHSHEERSRHLRFLAGCSCWRAAFQGKVNSLVVEYCTVRYRYCTKNVATRPAHKEHRHIYDPPIHVIFRYRLHF